MVNEIKDFFHKKFKLFVETENYSHYFNMQANNDNDYQ